MVITDEQIYNSLPPGLQGDLKAFGALESHTCNELHKFMLEMREKHSIPPWDAFTLLFQRAALGSGESKRMTAESSWYLFDLTEERFELNAYQKKDWCVVNLQMTNTQTVTSSVSVAVQPSKQLIWSYRSEAAVISQRVYSSSSFKSGCQTSIPRERVIERAEQAISHGSQVADLAFKAHTRMCGTRAYKKEAQAPEDLAATESDKYPLLDEQEEHSGLTPEQREVMLTVFELAAAKARELGMHSTIARWKTTLSPIIGQEFSNSL